MSTELEIINAMLAAVGSNGVTSTVGRHPALIKALPILNRTNTQLQNYGHWFNTDKGLTLTADAEGEFVVPQTTLRADTTDRSSPYVRRGRRMYDPHNHTYKINETSIDIDVVIQLDYEYLPFAAWDTIRAKAVWHMLISAEADQITLQAAKDDVDETQRFFDRERRSQSDTSLRNNPNYAYIMAGMPRVHSRSTNPKYLGG